MKHLVYVHQRNVALVETLGNAVHKMLVGRRPSPPGDAGRHRLKGRLLGALVWVVAIAMQAALIVLVAELVELVHGVIELYLELADLQLTLQSQYVAVTGPQTAR